MDGFVSAFADPLRLLSEKFGVRPRIRWGVVFWQS
jgi:hypothetical protein